MKAHVYLVLRKGEWHPFISVDIHTDCQYWLDRDFREGTLGGAGTKVMDGLADCMLLWEELLPLGEAVEAVELWEEQASPRINNALAAEEAFTRCLDKAGGGERFKGSELVRKERQASGEELVRKGNCVSGEELVRNERRASRKERVAADERRPSARAARRAEGAALAAAAAQAAAALQGRALLRGEAHALLAASGAAPPAGAAGWSSALQLAALQGRLRLRSAIAAERHRRALQLRPRRRCRCLRCGSGEARMRRTACAACGRVCAYCEACLAMGRSRECELLVLGTPAAASAASRPAAALPAAEQRLSRWGLSPAQQEAALAALRHIEAASRAAASPLLQRQFLLWAVTGAGKTEMIFPLVESVLLRGGRALIATPRRDVVLELDPRIRKAFPDRSVVTLYGGSEQRWEQGEITLATTHQLQRFSQAFQLVIIDELDAFPYHGDPILHYAAEKCRAPDGITLLLSATPPVSLQKEVRRGHLPHARVPVRFHRHPLPVPKLLRTSAVTEMIRTNRLPNNLRAAIRQSLERGAQVFVFVQQIRHAEPIAALIRSLAAGDCQVESTSSKDPDRAGKVQRFRSKEIRLLVTTTILERGVTITGSDVIILDADGKLFDEASLVQMAGRAGRSADDPNGSVVFCGKARSKHQAAAVKQIRLMNKLARQRGYLLPGYGNRTNKEG